MDVQALRRSQWRAFWDKQGKSVTRCAFIIFYVSLVVASYTVLQATPYIAFGVSLYMIASGVLFGIFVFACTGSNTRLCECCRFGCSLLLALALTFFILVSGGVAADAAAASHTPLLPRPSLVLDSVIVASIGFFVVIVILLPVLAPVKVQTRDADRMTIQMTAVYAQFASRSDRGSNGSAVNPTLLIGNGTGPPGTETLLLYSRVRGQPPTYEESQLRNSQRDQPGALTRRSSASSNNSRGKQLAKTVFVFPGGSLDRSRAPSIPNCPPPPYEEQEISSALVVQKQIQNGTATTTVWSSESGLGAQGISIEGLFPPSYEEATEWERPPSTRRRPELFGGNQPGTSGYNTTPRVSYYCSDRYYVHQRPTAPQPSQNSPSTTNEWRTRARSILDSCSDTDDSRNGTLQRPQPKGVSSSADYLAQQQAQPPQQNQAFPVTENYPLYGTLPLQHNHNMHRQQQPIHTFAASQVFSNQIALPVDHSSRSVTLRPADWGRYNRIRSFLDGSDTSTEECTSDIPAVHAPNYANYRTYHGGRRYQNHWRRQYAMDEYHGVVYGTTGRAMCQQTRTAFYYPHTGSLQRPSVTVNHPINTTGLPNAAPQHPRPHAAAGCPQRSSSAASTCGCPELSVGSMAGMYYQAGPAIPSNTTIANSLASVNGIPPHLAPAT